MMTGPLSIGRPSGDWPVLSAGHLRTGFVVVGMPPLDRQRHERDERRPDREQVEIKCRYSEKPGCLVEDDQERGRKNQRPEQEKGDKKLAGAAGSQHRPTRGCVNRTARWPRTQHSGRNIGDRIATRFVWASLTVRPLFGSVPTRPRPGRWHPWSRTAS